MTLLERIVHSKRSEVERSQAQKPLQVLEREAAFAPPVRPFPKALPPGIKQPRIIAEMKRKSPSKGVIRDPYDPAALAGSYKKGGASALSILTDPPFFGGALSDLTTVRGMAGLDLPLLRKDFLLLPYQVWESRCAGADIVLLIVRILSRNDLRALLGLARDLGMAALVETHTEEEVLSALEVGADLIGINHRDLDTLEIDLERGARLAAMIPEETGKIAESGLKTNDEYKRMGALGFSGVLVGESFLSAEDPGHALKEFCGTLG